MARNEKETLYQAIWEWHCIAANGDTGAVERQATWREIEAAITALDNAAYDRAAERFQRERAEERQRTTTMTLANDDKRQEIKRLEAERDAVRDREGMLYGEIAGYEQHQQELEQERDQAQAEVRVLRADVERLKEQIGRLQTNGHRVSTDRERLRRLLRKMATGQAAASEALETLADRYHAQMCYKSRPYPHSRASCQHVLAVIEANEVLAGVVEPEEPTPQECSPQADRINRALDALARLEKQHEGLPVRDHVTQRDQDDI